MTAVQTDLNAVPCAPVWQDTLSLGMAHLSPFGLSEPWLLRDCGDRHWGLIAQALGRDDIAFRDEAGRAIYAAFCATALDLAAPAGALLGAPLDITSTLSHVATNRIGSEHRFTSRGRYLGSLRMISCFLRHDGDGSNQTLVRSPLPGLESVPQADAPLSDLLTRARSRARSLRSVIPKGAPMLSYTPVPALDFNAVGLLYFPTFSKIAERAAPATQALASREVLYLGNLDPGEAVAVTQRPDGILLRAGARTLGFATTRWHGDAP